MVELMSLNEIMEAIPRLSFAERQQLVRRAIEADEELTAREKAVLDKRLESFQPNPDDGLPGESLKRTVRQRLKPQ
jgi:hypothetical protein